MSRVGSLRGVQAIPEPCNSNSNSNSIYSVPLTVGFQAVQTVYDEFNLEGLGVHNGQDIKSHRHVMSHWPVPRSGLCRMCMAVSERRCCQPTRRL
jgi:hypothetical protein